MTAGGPFWITGSSAACSAGRTAQAAWEAARAGRSGIGPIGSWNAAGWPCEVAGEIAGFNPRDFVPDRKLHKLLSRMDMLGLHAAHQALADSGLLAYRDSLPEVERASFNERCAVLAASGGGTYSNQYDFFPLLSIARGGLKAFGEELTSTVSPMWLLRTLPNNVLCYAGVQTGFKGPNANFTSHSVSGFLAIREALRLLADGKADRALVIGYDSPVEPQTVLYFAGLGLLSRDAVRSFDADRDGCLLGEGAAALVIETAESASRRGAEPRGEILGAGTATEAGGILAIGEDGEAVRRAVEECLAEAGLEPDRVSMIAAHGNGTVHSDASEGRALLEVFGPDGPAVTGFKWAVGHLMGASAILEAVLALLSLERGEAPGIAGLRRLDPALAGLRVSPSAQPIEGDTGIVVSRGFGGSAAALAIKTAGRE